MAAKCSDNDIKHLQLTIDEGALANLFHSIGAMTCGTTVSALVSKNLFALALRLGYGRVLCQPYMDAHNRGDYAVKSKVKQQPAEQDPSESSAGRCWLSGYKH